MHHQPGLAGDLGDQRLGFGKGGRERLLAEDRQPI
jgi:hypothetical protein